LGSGLITTSAFATQYPAFTQAIVTAMVKGARFIQTNINNPNKVYAALPAVYQQTTPVGLFVQAWVYNAPMLAASNGLFEPVQIAGAIKSLQSLDQLSSNASFNQKASFTNKYVTAAYKSIGVPVPSASGSGSSSSSTTSTTAAG
jgi:hypothetical protein